MTAYSVEVVNTRERFQALEKAWEELLAQQQHPDFFFSHLWMTTFLDHFGEGKSLSCLVLRDQAGTLQGVAPLVVVQERWRGMPVRVGRFVSDPSLNMRRTDFMAGEGREDVIRAFFEYLAVHRDIWDVLDLNGFLSESPHVGWVEDAARETGLFVSPRTVGRVSRVLPIEWDWESYLRMRSANFRRNLLKERKHLERLGTVSFSLYRDASEIEDGLNKIKPILLSRLRAASFDQVNEADRRLIEFTQDVSRRLSRIQGVEIRILAINEQPAACLLSFIRDNVVYPFLTKYDPVFEAGSPGRAVIMNLVQDAYQLGYREIDFLSTWPYISRITPHTRAYVGVTLFHRGWYSQTLRLWKHTIAPLCQGIRRFLHRKPQETKAADV